MFKKKNKVFNSTTTFCLLNLLFLVLFCVQHLNVLPPIDAGIHSLSDNSTVNLRIAEHVR